jgi:DNA-binding CsgD family transcriptional regulator
MDSKKKEILSFWSEFKEENQVYTRKPDFSMLEQLGWFFTAGEFFYFVFDFANLRFDFVSDSYRDITGNDPDNFTLEKWLSLVHPDDLEIVQQSEVVAKDFLFNFIETEDLLRYKVSYSFRMRGADGRYFQNLHQSQTISQTDSDSIGQIMGTETNISHISQTTKHTVSFIDMKGKESYLDIDIFNPVFEKEKRSKRHFTEQELNVLKRISYGLSTEQIAEDLFISPHTVRKHRNNILKKEKPESMTALISDLIRKGTI